MFVVAASHLILRRLHPSQALITSKKQSAQERALEGMARPRVVDRNGAHTLESLVAVVFVYKNIIWISHDRLDLEGGWPQDPAGGGGDGALFWVSLG